MTAKATTPAAPAVPAVATPAAPAAAATPPEEDFDSVFAAITAEGFDTPPVTPPEDATPPADDKAPATPAAAATADAGATPPEGTPAVVVDPAVAATTPPVVPPVVPPETDWKAKFEALEAERARAPVAPAPPAPPAPAAPVADVTPAQPEAIQWYTPTAEEAATLAEHATAWPDISKAEAIRTKQAVYNAVQYMFSQMKQKYDPVLDLLNNRADALEQNATLTMLQRDHSDYNAIHDKVEAWVETLPTFAKAGAKLTMKDGTPEEVSELVAEYKKMHPVATTPAAPAAPAPAAPPAPKTELSPAAKKAASKLTVVDSKRTALTSAADPNDFDAAWAEASAIK